MSYVEGSALRNVFSKRTRIGAIVLVSIAMLGSVLTLGLTGTSADAAAQAAIVNDTFCYGLDEGSGDPTSDPQWLHEVQLGTGGAPATKLQGNNGDPQLLASGNVESIALRNDASELYVFDPTSGDMLLVEVDAPSSTSTPTDFNLTGLGDIDAMFFQNDTDGDPTNDVLWTLLDNAGNDADQLFGYNPNGTQVAGSPITLDLPETLPDGSPLGVGQENTVEGATWLPDTSTFYISYTVTSSTDVVSSLASLGTGASPSATATRIGDLPIDVEGLGTDGAVQLFLTTGEDGTDANNLFHLDEAGPTTAVLLDMAAGATPDDGDPLNGDQGGDADFESIDCAWADISLTKTAIDVTRNADGTTDITFEFDITNSGELLLEGVDLDDPMTNYTVVSGPTPDGPGGASDCSATAEAGTEDLNIGETCTATWTYVVDDAPGDYDNTATVTGTPPNGIADPVTANASTTTTIPAAPSTVTIIKTAAADGTDCAGVTPIDGPDSVAVANGGGPVVMCIEVTNAGPLDVTGIQVDDDVHDECDNAAVGDLNAGDSTTYSCTFTTGAATNTATITVATDADSNDVSGDSDPASVTENPALTAIIGDLVFDDLDDDGIQDGGAEVGIDGVTVNLWTSSGGAPDTQINTTTTAGGGLYQFTGVAAGDYHVQFIAPSGRTFVAQDQGGDDAADSDPDPSTGITGVITVAAGVDDLTIDAGIAQVQAPGLDIVKTVVSPSTACPANFAAGADGLDTIQADIGDDVKYCINVINNGPGDAFNVSVDDDFDASAPRDLGDLASGAEATPFEYTHTIVADNEVNVATVTGEDSIGNPAPSANDNAGTTPLGSISNFVFEDTNTDAVQDAGDTGIDGVTVNLWTSVGGAPDTQINTTTTAGGGLYLFDGLADGDYHVQFVAPAGRTFVAQDQGGDDAADSDPNPADGITGVITLAGGNDDDSVDAGINPVIPGQATIGNFVWNDTNRDGIQDAGELGIDGVTVNVYATDGAGNLQGAPTEVTTAGGGLWTLNVDPGTYRVNVVLPSGSEGFSPLDAGADDAVDSDVAVDGPTFGFTGVYTVAADEVNLTIDAGILFPIPPAELGDRVWNDANGNGIQDAGELGVQGIVVQALDSGNNVAGSDTTDANGDYLITGLAPGTYTVSFINTTTGQFTAQDSGSDDTVDSDADSAGQTAAVTLAANDSNLTIDAGIVFPGTASISNFVFDDVNSNGIQDAGETGVEGATVTLWTSVSGTPGAVITSQTTGADGLYLFGGLSAGDYFVQFAAPAGRNLSAQDQGADDAADSDPDPTSGVTAQITLADAENNDTVDAGVLPAPIDPVIGLAKDVVGTPLFVGNGQFQVTYSFVIENIGNVDLTNVTLADDFALTFVDATVVSGPTPAASGCSQAVVPANGGTSLAVGESCTAIWSVVVTNLVSNRVYDNTATVTGTAPDNSTVTDISDDGTVTDTDQDGEPNEPGENDPTPVVIVIGNCQQVNPPAECNQNPNQCFDNNGVAIAQTGCVRLPDPGPFTPQVPEEPPASVPAPDPDLAFTGSSANILATLALALMGVGGALMIGARRRNDED
ncbi:MAG: SdrD B-like domain-containing protein [Actinomycetota bacterium]